MFDFPRSSSLNLSWFKAITFVSNNKFNIYAAMMNRCRLFAQLLCGAQFQNAIWQQVTVARYHSLAIFLPQTNNSMTTKCQITCILIAGEMWYVASFWLLTQLRLVLDWWFLGLLLFSLFFFFPSSMVNKLLPSIWMKLFIFLNSFHASLITRTNISSWQRDTKSPKFVRVSKEKKYSYQR